MAYNNNGANGNINPMAFFGQNGQNGQGIQMPQNGQNAHMSAGQPAQGVPFNSGLPNGHQLTQAQIAMLAQQQRNQQQQAAAAFQQFQQQQQHQHQQQRAPVPTSTINNAALIQQMLAQNAQNTPPRPTQHLPHVQQVRQSQSPAPGTPQPTYQLIPELVQMLPTLRATLAPEAYQLLVSGRLNPAQQKGAMTKFFNARSSAAPRANLTAAQHMAQRSGSPSIQPQQLMRQPSAPGTMAPAVLQPSQVQMPRRTSIPQHGSPASGTGPLTPQPLHPSVLTTPPQATISTMPGPPRADDRRGSNPGQPIQPMQQSQSFELNPSALAAVIPQSTPATFQLDQSKLRVPVPKPPAPAAPIVQPPSPAPSQAKEEMLESKKRPAPSPVPRREETPPRDVREVRVEERKRNEGMRGSMRADLASMMWAAGDARHPDVNTVDYMEDMVVDFLADLCRPVPPMRSGPGASYASVPLSSSVIRHRLAAKPVFRKYLERFDTMVYLDGEIKKNKKGFSTSANFDFEEIVATVGKDYLEVDVQTEPKKKSGRPPKRAHPSGLALPFAATPGGQDPDAEDGEPAKKRNKPGPKKGTVKAEPGTEPKKPKKVYKRKKEGSVAVGSPLAGPAASSPAW